MESFHADPQVRVGHVHLRVGNLERALRFYRDVLGFAVTADRRPAGVPAVYVAAGDYHHHIGLSAFQGEGIAPPPPGHTGLYHFALLYPSAVALARAVEQILERGYPIARAQDHGATVSVYLNDPDGNGIELYYDRPREQWFDGAGHPEIRNQVIALAQVLAAPEGVPGVSS